MDKPTPYETRWKNRAYYWKRFWAQVRNSPSLVPYYTPIPKRYLAPCSEDTCGHVNSFKSVYDTTYVESKTTNSITGVTIYRIRCAGCGSEFRVQQSDLNTYNHQLQLRVTG